MREDPNKIIALTKKDPGYIELEFAKIDTERHTRTGLPEIIYAPGKTSEQLVALFASFPEGDVPIIASRISAEKATAVLEQLPHLTHFPKANILAHPAKNIKNNGCVAVITAGTSDGAVAEEAAVTLELLGVSTQRIRDVGVAGLHRLMHQMPALRQVDVIIVIAGMEGALPSVVGGLVKAPIVAIPTSVGYGASFEGLSALLGMMNSCAPGVSVVNIDNGFGGAICAFKMLLMAQSLTATSSLSETG